MPRLALSGISIAALKKEIERRAAKLAALKAQRDALDGRIAEIEGVVGEAPKAGKKRGRKPKPKRATGKPLIEYIREVLAAAPLGIKEIEAKILASGYPTTADSIYKPIMAILGKHFKKLDRGVYGLKGKPGRKPGKVVAASAAKARAKRGAFSQTAEQMILGLLAGGKVLTTAEAVAAWRKEGRGGKADNTLTKLVKEGKVKRQNVAGQRGSRYSLA
jgi:hypothetical protein